MTRATREDKLVEKRSLDVQAATANLLSDQQREASSASLQDVQPEAAATPAEQTVDEEATVDAGAVKTSPICSGTAVDSKPTVDVSAKAEIVEEQQLVNKGAGESSSPRLHDDRKKNR